MKNDNHSKTNFVDRAIQLKLSIIQQGLSIPDLIKGCSKSEVLKLENEYQILLTESYKVFLENFGHSLGGKVMNDCEILYNDVFSLTKTIQNEILINEEDPVLPEKAFVFTGRYNEQFTFFDASGIVNEPVIYYYHIDEGDFTKAASSVFEIIEDEVRFSHEIQQYKRTRNQ